MFYAQIFLGARIINSQNENLAFILQIYAFKNVCAFDVSYGSGMIFLNYQMSIKISTKINFNGFNFKINVLLKVK